MNSRFVLSAYTRQAIATDAERAAKLGLIPAHACSWNHIEFPAEHRLWMEAYRAALGEKRDG